MEENIQYLFSLLDSDQQKQLIKQLIEEIETKYKLKPKSIYNNWFSGKYPHVPEKYQLQVLSILQKKIELSNLTPQL